VRDHHFQDDHHPPHPELIVQGLEPLTVEIEMIEEMAEEMTEETIEETTAETTAEKTGEKTVFPLAQVPQLGDVRVFPEPLSPNSNVS